MPLSSWKMIQAFRRRAFFYCRPPFGHPLPSRLLVALPRLLGRPLQAPLHGPQDLPHMSAVIAHSRDPLEEGGNPRQRPQLRSETMGPGSLPQGLVHQSQLLVVQFRRPPSPARTTNPARLIRPPCLKPTAHALAADVEFPRHLRLDPLASDEQPRGAAPPLLQGRKISPGRTGLGHVTILPLGPRSCHSIMRDSVSRAG